jgi:hypothetical protein
MGLEMIGQKILGKPEGTPCITDKILGKITPQTQAHSNFTDQVDDKWRELYWGYESDNEWINDTNSKKPSTGKGVRHKYI